jgi:hypothetical protein
MYGIGINISDSKNEIAKAEKTEDSEIKRDFIREKQEGIDIAERLMPQEEYFNSLSYTEKLSFWKKNKLHPLCWAYHVGENEQSKSKFFSVFPEKKEEFPIYFEEYARASKMEIPLMYDLDKIKEIYFSKTLNNPQAITYTENELNKYNSIVERHFKGSHPNLSPSYKTGFNSIVNREEIDFERYKISPPDFHSVLNGIIHAQIIPILEDQLVILKEEKKKPKNLKSTDENNSKIETHEYSLRQFIDMAIRWKIDAIHSTVSKHHPFSPIFDNYIKNGRGNLENFRIGLKNTLLQTKPESLRIHEIDFKDRFLPSINRYLTWYNEHLKEFAKFGGYSPYEIMYEIAVSTKREILMYFPEEKTNSQSLPTKTGKENNSQASFKLKSGTIKETHQDILNVLKSGGLISKQTTPPNFRKIFSGNEVSNKIEWIGTISSLHIFVSEIWKLQGNGKGKWKTALNCFTHAKGLTEKKLQNNKDVKPEDKVTVKKAIKHFTTA